MMSSETPDPSKDLIKKEPDSGSSIIAPAATSSNSSSSPAVPTAITTTNSSLQPAAGSNSITAAATSNPTLLPKVLVVTNSPMVTGKSGDPTTVIPMVVTTSAFTSANSASVTALTTPSSKPSVNSSSTSTPGNVTQLLNKTAETASVPNALASSPAVLTNQSTSGNLPVSNNTASALPQTAAPTVNNTSNNTATANNTAQTNGEISSSENDKEKAGSVVVLNKQRLQELVAEIDSNEQLDEDVEDMLLNIADDFIDNLGEYLVIPIEYF